MKALRTPQISTAPLKMRRALRSLVLGFACGLSAAGCTTPAAYPAHAAPERDVKRMADAGRPMLALVLSEGSWRAFSHIGVIRVLEEAGVRPDLVVGVSAGAIVGAIYASGANASELARIASTADWSRVTEPALPFLIEGAVYRGEGLQALVEDLVAGKPMERLAIPFVTVATELETGRLVVFRRGETGLAVRASGAVPGRYAPVRIGTHSYVDGGLVSPLPTETARRLGADFVIAVDVGYPPAETEIGGFMSVVYQSFHVQKHRIRQMEAELADVLIVPDIPRSAVDYGHENRGMLIAAGERTARRELQPLLQKIAAWRNSIQASSRLKSGVRPASPTIAKENNQ